jgi:hypothetical protein
MITVLVELLLTHDANSKLPATELHIAMTISGFPLPTSTDVGNFKGKASFLQNNFFCVNYTTCTVRNVRKIRDFGAHFCLV